jgi:hypothetical protein
MPKPQSPKRRRFFGQECIHSVTDVMENPIRQMKEKKDAVFSQSEGDLRERCPQEAFS